MKYPWAASPPPGYAYIQFLLFILTLYTLLKVIGALFGDWDNIIATVFMKWRPAWVWRWRKLVAWCHRWAAILTSQPTEAAFWRSKEAEAERRLQQARAQVSR